MAESTVLLVDEVLPHRPKRQWVLSVPHPLRFLFASQLRVMGKVLGIVYRTLATRLRDPICSTKQVVLSQYDEILQHLATLKLVMQGFETRTQSLGFHRIEYVEIERREQP